MIRLSTLFVLSLFVLSLLGHAALAQATLPVLIDDFDGGAALGQRWTVGGDAIVKRIPVLPATNHEGVAGMKVIAKATAGARLITRDTMARPPYERSESLRFRARADGASPSNTFDIEIQVFSSERRAWLWRKVPIDSSKWKTYEQPLRYFRHSPHARLRWEESKRLLIYFRETGSLELDQIELVPGTAHLGASEVFEIAFNQTPIQSIKNELFEIATDSQSFAPRTLATELNKLVEMIYRDFPGLPRPAQRVPVVIFSSREDYRQFWQRFASKFRSRLSPVQSDGFALFGVAGSSIETRRGETDATAVRPVFIQEACHALLARVLRISNTTEWMHEGIANHYQLNWSHQDVQKVMSKMLANGKFTPLPELVSGRVIRSTEYGQAVLFVQWLLIDDTRRMQFQRALKVMAERTSTDLNPIAPQVFGRTVSEMESEWLAWCRKPHPAQP